MPRRDPEPEEEEIEEDDPEPLELAPGIETERWWQAYMALSSGAASGAKGKAVEVDDIAFGADDMIRNLRKRTIHEA